MPALAATLRGLRERPPQAAFLLASHAAVSGSGFVFWFAAGRITGASAVGAASALIAVTLLVSTISQFGLPQAVLRFWREAEDREAVTGAAMTLVWALALLGGLVGVLLFPLIGSASGEIDFVTSTAVVVLGSIGVAQANFVWHVASAAGAPRVAFTMSVLEGACKVVLAAPLALGFEAGGIALAWCASVLFPIAWGTWVLLPRAAGHPIRFHMPRREVMRGLSSFSAASHIGDVALFTPTTGVLGWLVPTIIVARFGTEVGGVFYICWAIVAGLAAIPFAMATSTVASGVHGSLLRTLGLYAALAAVPAAAVALIAHPLLAILGAEYIDLGVGLLRTLTLGAVAAALSAGLAAHLKLAGHLRALHLVGLAAGVPTIAAAALAPTAWGAEAVALAWFVAQLAGGAVAFVAAHSSGNRVEVNEVAGAASAASVEGPAVEGHAP